MRSRIRNSGVAAAAVMMTLGLFYSTFAFADLADVEGAIEQARENYRQRFSEFTDDKNVMGKKTYPDGGKAGGSRKTRFNQDDEGPFQSDLTYHDFSFDTTDEPFGNKNKDGDGKGGGAKSRPLYAGISPHGGLSEANGSSLLERTAYQLHDQASKENEKDKKKNDEKEGIQIRSIFKVETKEVNGDGGGGGNGAPGGLSTGTGGNAKAPGDDKEKEKVERWTLVDDAKKKLAEVGSNSFDTVERAAKDPENKNNPNVMGTLLFYYEAANRAIVSLYKSSLANLTQARAQSGIKGPGGGVRLSEDAPTCEAWEQQQMAEVNKRKGDNKEAKEQVQKMSKRCKQMIAKSFKDIQPTFEGGDDGKEEPQLKDKGIKGERARERDWRLQLTAMDRTGISVTDIPSNWAYTKKDDEAKVTQNYTQNGAPSGEASLTMREQLESYNGELQKAAEAYNTLKQRNPKFNANPQSIMNYQIPIGKEKLSNIVKVPESAVMEDVETTNPKQEPMPETYVQLTKGKAGR